METPVAKRDLDKRLEKIALEYLHQARKVRSKARSGTRNLNVSVRQAVPSVQRTANANVHVSAEVFLTMMDNVMLSLPRKEF